MSQYLRGNKRALLYNVEWQRLRVSLLPTYQTATGGWSTLDGTEQNVAILEAYIGAMSTPDQVEQFSVRMYRVINLLNAQRMSFARHAKKNAPEDEYITFVRDKLNGAVIESHVLHAARMWRWDPVELDLGLLFKNDQVWFYNVKNDLHDRLGKWGGHAPSKNSEVLHFLHLMTKVETTLS